MSTAKSFDSSTAPLISTKNSPYFKSGITGIGNVRKLSDALPIQPKPIIKRRRSGVLFSSIGGFGNQYKFEERAIASQNDILARRVIRRSKSTTFHYGIGGVGNQTASACVSSSSVTSSSYSNSIMACPSGADKTKQIILGLFRRN